MTTLALTGTGVYTPAHSISNEELVAVFNEYVRRYNAAHADAIAAGTVAQLLDSSVDFIIKASGIKRRYVMDKAGVLDPAIMCPRIAERPNDQISVLAEMAIASGRDALAAAERKASEIDAVIVSCANPQRAYPAIAIEVQNALGVDGYAFDMNVGCASAAFALQVASDMIAKGDARAILICSPEICSGHLDFRDRDSHFIFGDAAAAMVVEHTAAANGRNSWEVVSTKLKTKFSNNIRNNFGFLNRTAPEGIGSRDKLFVQEGRKVFKEVIPMVSELILTHLAENAVSADTLRRLWLHQANLNMNELIAHRVLGRTASADEAPIILDEYGNTSSAGSVIAFHKYSTDLAPGDFGLLCAFGAGYSAGSVILRKLAA
ncbi:MAG: beta-ketoacyl-ACP synthase III [Alphaproteobacteria bacterium]|nr:beta-ketoacyl-ACP synthase III [Alphaproteobacteria bacterium]MDE2499511.1 beta-ketoacyl-ACP synthase III [Alphaproteobacteria bacterium]